MKVTVIGCGRWGSFLAWYANQLGHKVTVYGKAGEISYEQLVMTHKNEYVTFPKSIELTNDLQRAVRSANVLLVSVPSQAFRSVMGDIRSQCDMTGKYLVTNMKGIEISTGKRLSEVALEFGLESWQIAVWAGPGHVQEFTQGNPNCMIIDGYERTTIERIVEYFKSPLIRFYYGSDVIGTEIGAAAKNVMGIVAGVLDGMNLTTLKGALMARGSREVARLIKALGGNPLSAYGLCHIGDYETTLFSEHSHNRMWGENYVKGKKYDKLAEGVHTARAMSILADKYGVDMPITTAVNTMILDKVPPREVMEQLFDRTLKDDLV
ncbi:MAG: NAD(P)H-dependent glycerol-3-phosphate dehydrogenase [Clostridiales bacterium]|nr:NAD(P)H-dependent glycerol-3-phosphate dehydrogenase [Clostridiales bacterium]MDE6618032.1 NAD(P)H-dependent glycerol-3-phosphate dehydrogenase [Clostridiales bacterium]